MKKLISLLLIMTFLLTLFPTNIISFAAELTDSCTITTTGAEYETDGSDALLVDGKYGVAKEPNVTFATGMCAKLTADDTIEYAFTEEKSVSRLDLWIYPAGAVNEYEVQKWDATAQDWAEAPVASGSFAQGISGGSYTVYSPVVFNEAVSAEKLRFVVKSLGADAAYVSETELHDSNELNMLQLKQFTASNDGNQFFSKYVRGFSVSNNHENSTSAALLEQSWGIWPGWSNSGGAYVTPKSGETTAYYQTKFPGNKVKINRAVVNVKKGSATLIKISYKDTGNEADWTTAKTISGSFTIGNTYTIDIPSSVAANTWRISLEGCDTDFQMGRPDHGTGLYALSEDKLDSFSVAASKIFDNASVDDEGNYINLPSTLEHNGTDYPISWESDSDLIALEGDDLGKIDYHNNDVDVTFTAKIEDADEITHYLTKKITLPARENKYIPTVSNGVELADGASVLTDGFFYSAYDKRISGVTSPAENPGKFAIVTENDSYFEYTWNEASVVKRLDLWVYPQDALGKYEIWASDDDGNLEKVSDGTVSENVNTQSSITDENRAVYYPILIKNQGTGEFVTTTKLRFVIKELNSDAAYIAEAAPSNTNDISLTALPMVADGENVGYSHFMSGYVLSNTDSDNLNYLKHSTKVWPVLSDGNSPKVIPSGSTCWYATGFDALPININRIVVPIETGSAQMVEVLCAEGDESGFSTSTDIFKAPDENAPYISVAKVKGTFNSDNPAVIDLVNPPSSKYWMVKITKPSSDMSLGRVGFYKVDENEISKLPEIAAEIFDHVTTDMGTTDSAKSHINFKYQHTSDDGKNYNVSWESTSKLVDTATGNISYHEADEYTALTALITDPDNEGLSYCVSKQYTLKGMREVYVFSDENDPNSKSEDAESVLTDGFTYGAYDKSKLTAPSNAFYYLDDKFIKLGNNGSGIEFHWENSKILRRLELWLWPVDAISEYKIEVSADGVSWDPHCEGVINDRYAENPTARPQNASDSAGMSYFYPIVFEEPTEAVNYIRFVATKLRDEAEGAYIAEASFLETNEINLAARGSIQGTSGKKTGESKYMVGFYTGLTDGTVECHTSMAWPMFDSGSPAVIKTQEGDLCWWMSRFQGAPVVINQASITVSAGEVQEYEILCPVTDSPKLTWNVTGPPRPDTLSEWKTVARVSGKFTKGTSTKIHFDNKTASQYWMIKITKATDNVGISSVGLYSVAESELNSSSFILSETFNDVSDTELDNVIKDKMNISSEPMQLTLSDGNVYEVIWNYDDTMVNSDGTLIPCETDREMKLRANIGGLNDGYKHVLEKTYYLLGSDSSPRTEICKYEGKSLGAMQKEDCPATLAHGFKFDGKKEVEIDFAAGVQSGAINFMSGDVKLLTLSVRDGEIIANEGTENELSMAYTEKIKVDINDDNYNVSVHNGAIYSVALYNKPLSSNKLLDKIVLETSDAQALSVDCVAVKVVSSELFNAIEEQFKFSKISPSYRATNLNGNLTLIDKIDEEIDDITFTYAGDGVVVSNDGTVNTAVKGEGWIKVIGTNSLTGESFAKTFNVLTGRVNEFGEAKSSSPNIGKDGKTGDFVVDGSLETEFVTNATNWRISIDTQKKDTPFNKLRIYEADTEAKIQEYTVNISNNNVDFTEIYKGTTINSGEIITIPYCEARFVRIIVTKVSAPGTGIKEVCAYNEMSDSEKLDYDFNDLTKDLAIAAGTVIKKTGKFGTAFTLSSDNSAVTFNENADKTGWIVNVGSTSSEVTVTITLKAANGTAPVKEKPYSLTLFGDTDIRDNEIIGDSNTGSGSGGGGGGGGGGKPSTSVSVTPNLQTIVNSTAVNELTNHWGANEIKSLIAHGVVQGDGKTLNLKGAVTRAEFCKMIVTGFGYEVAPYNGTFSDVSTSDWFAQFAQTAFEYGIMSGDAEGFRGNDTISRQEMAVVLINALKSYLPELTAEGDMEFEDKGSIASWASEAVKIASSLKLLNGYDTGDFRPLKNLQRDEAMVVVYRVLSHIGK